MLKVPDGEWRLKCDAELAFATFALSGSQRRDLPRFSVAFALGMLGIYGLSIPLADSLAYPTWVGYAGFAVFLASGVAATGLSTDGDTYARRMTPWILGFLLGGLLGVMPRYSQPWWFSS
jgi:hypothetical protein